MAMSSSGPVVANDPVNHAGPTGDATAGNIADLALGLIPEVGDVLNVRDAIEEPTAANIMVAEIGLIPEAAEIGVICRVFKSVIKEEKVAATVEREAGRLPKPPTGPGRIPKAERDPKRFFRSLIEQQNGRPKVVSTPMDAGPR